MRRLLLALFPAGVEERPLGQGVRFVLYFAGKAELSAGKKAVTGEEQVGRLESALPLPQLRLPFLFTPDIGPAEVETLADVLAKEIEALQ